MNVSTTVFLSGISLNKMNRTKVSTIYTGPATYQITVQGKVDKVFIKSFTGMKVIHTHIKNKELSTITGEVMDQAALSGIINFLIDSRFSVESIVKIGE